MGMDYDDDDTTNIKYIKQSEKAILPGRVGKLPEDLSTLLNWSTSCNINKKNNQLENNSSCFIKYGIKQKKSNSR